MSELTKYRMIEKEKKNAIGLLTLIVAYIEITILKRLRKLKVKFALKISNELFPFLKSFIIFKPTRSYKV